MIIYPYKKGEDVVKLIAGIISAGYVTGVCSLCLGFLKNKKIVISEIDSTMILFCILSLLFILILNIVCILIIQIIKINRNTNMQEVMNLGYKTSGKVLSVEYFNKRVYKGRIERYSLVVQYVDIDGILKKFETVPLAIVPKSGYSIICDVFIYNNKCYAYNFKNFHIDRNVDKERKIEMIVIMSIAFILGITAILLC
ncbi:MAG: hypothetical protein IJD40_12155 [Lachnospiraceae bacterium]|nr:hypothetical protein [Lachnospiraceae bacterium]